MPQILRLVCPAPPPRVYYTQRLQGFTPQSHPYQYRETRLPRDGLLFTPCPEWEPPDVLHHVGQCR